MDKPVAAPIVDRSGSTRDLTEFLCASVDKARVVEHPFFHIEIDQVFPEYFYRQIVSAMPVSGDYRSMNGLSKNPYAVDGGQARFKIDLFPEYIRHLPAAKRQVWGIVGAALRSPALEQAFIRKLLPGLRRRFGADFTSIGFYPVPILTRDITGYRLPPHQDSPWKGITVQIYLPPDDSIRNVGTILNERRGPEDFPIVSRMPFAPNFAYAFAPADNTWHSADQIDIGAKSRDSILLTYFVDSRLLQRVRNRGKRVGNFFLNEWRSAVGS